MQSVEVFKVLDFDPMISDVHCGLCTRLKYEVLRDISILKANIEESNESAKLGKWDAEKKSEYVSHIDEEKVNEMMTNIHVNP